MPLRATSDGQNYIAPLLTDAQWDDLKRRVRSKQIQLSLPCCGSFCLLRVSPLGNRHFYHRGKRNCDWKPETVHHINIKSEIVRASQKVGWKSQPESRGNDWKADVLAWHPNSEATKQAFEIQWTKQTLKMTRERQAKYFREGIPCLWLFRELPEKLGQHSPYWVSERRVYRSGRWDAHYQDGQTDRSHLITPELPMFQICANSAGGFDIRLGAYLATLPLPEFIYHFLTGKIVFRKFIRVAVRHTDPLSDWVDYEAICGSEQRSKERIQPYNHWCFSPTGHFCPKHYRFPDEGE